MALTAAGADQLGKVERDIYRYPCSLTQLAPRLQGPPQSSSSDRTKGEDTLSYFT